MMGTVDHGPVLERVRKSLVREPGTIRIVDGKLTDPGFQWEDTGEKVDWTTWKPSTAGD